MPASFSTQQAAVAELMRGVLLFSTADSRDLLDIEPSLADFEEPRLTVEQTPVP